MLQDVVFQHGSFAAKRTSVASLATDRGINELNRLSGLEVVSITKFPGRDAVLFLQSTDIPWEYDYHLDQRNVGLRGFLSTDHRRKTICADIEEKDKDGWRVVDVVESSSGLLIFLFKRPVRGEVDQEIEGDS